ncbi:MAG: SBBP repeat-containing protein, partial [Armatimonadetes bacterium]|nr:SBBP repeat-containing protein [Armatimonadota bacterium]
MELLSRWRIWKVLTFSFLITTVAASGQQVLPSVKTVARSYAQMPLVFERNEGQTDNRVKYLSRGTGYSLFLTPSEAVFALRKSVPHDTLKPRHVKNVEGAGAVVRMQLVGGNPDANEFALQRLAGTSNYFVGNDRSRWYSGVENYGKVGFNGVYPGIDVVYYGNQKRLEYDFLVHPKAKPSLIRLKFAGVKRVKVLKSGALLLELGSGSLQWKAPVAYQERQGRQEHVAVKYILKGATEVSFTTGNYDHSRPLVIDPELVYSTFLGGNGEDFGDDITVDKEGSAYITGHTFSSTFPTTQGAFQLKRLGRTDAFVTKLSADGASLIYSTFLGGKEEETATGVVVDKMGNAYISGYTNSSNFPTTQGAFQSKYQGYYDAFVTNLSADGKSLIYSTYLGGAKWDDIATKIAVDASGFAFVTGASFSADFPTTSGAFQSVHRGLQSAFVAKFSPDGKSLVYSTLLGGKDSSAGSGVVVDKEGNAYISGYTNGYDFPVTLGAFQITKGLGYDAFVAKFSSDGQSLLYSTFLGGQEDDIAVGIALDAEGRAIVVGSTRSPDFPVTQGAFQSVSGGSYDAFVTKLSTDGASLVYSTYIGGTQQDIATGIVLDSIGNAFITGSTHSPEFPTTQGAFQIINRGYFDAFATKLSADGSRLLNSTYLGGKADDMGKSIAVDSVGSSYITGYTFSSNFPVTQGAYQTSYKVWAEAMCTKLNMADVSGKADTRVSTRSEEVSLSESITLYARLSRTVDGAGLVAKPLTFKLDGVALDVKYTINSGGVALLLYNVDISATLGKHVLTVDFAGDGNNKPSSGKATI